MNIKNMLAVLTIAAAVAARAEDAYIQTDGTQGVNSGWYMTPDTCVEIDFALTEVAAQARVFGADNKNTLQAGFYVDSSLKFSMGIGDAWKGYGTGISADTERHTAILDSYNSKMYFITDGVTNFTGTIDSTRTQTAKYPLGIASDCYDETGSKSFYNFSKCKLYRICIRERGELKHDYVPYLENGVAGFKDAVTGVFIKDDRTTGAKPLVAGDDVASGTDGYLLSDGATGLNSRFRMTPTARLELDFALEGTPENGKRILGMDNNDGQGGTRFSFFKDGTCWAFYWGDACKYQATTLNVDTGRHTMIFDSAASVAAIKTGVTTQWRMTVTDVRTIANKFPLGVFGNVNSASGTSFQDGKFAKARIYRLKIFDAGKILHDYVPCQKGGVSGFRDLADGMFVTGVAPNYTVGGDVLVEQDDPYVQNTDRITYVDTGYLPTPKTRIEFDFALTDAGNLQQRLFDSQNANGLCVNSYVNGDGKLAWSFRDKSANGNTFDGIYAVDSLRQTIVLDGPARKASLITAGWTNSSVSISGDVTLNAVATLKLGATYSGMKNRSDERIYGLRFYEDGVLQRDFKPYVRNGVAGLYDVENDIFLPSADGNALTPGGSIPSLGATDAYLESTGLQGIDSGYYASGKTRVECDFALLSVTNYWSPKTAYQQRFFGEGTGKFYSTLYLDGKGDFVLGFSDTFRTTRAKTGADNDRHTAIIDIPNRRTYFVTGSTTNSTANIGGSDFTYNNTANFTSGIFCRTDSSGGKQILDYPVRMRLYSIRYYDNGVLAHEFLPYKKGDVIGLYDTMTKDVKTDDLTSGVPFKIGGAGVDGSGPVFKVAPTGAVIDIGGSTVLSAYAPGAVSYRWTKNGKPISGGENGDLEVSWAKGGRTDMYAVIAVFNVYGTTVESDPLPVQVKNVPFGMCVILR